MILSAVPDLRPHPVENRDPHPQGRRQPGVHDSAFMSEDFRCSPILTILAPGVKGRLSTCQPAA
jgi:hypothetical protein